MCVSPCLMMYPSMSSLLFNVSLPLSSSYSLTNLIWIYIRSSLSLWSWLKICYIESGGSVLRIWWWSCSYFWLLISFLAVLLCGRDFNFLSNSIAELMVFLKKIWVYTQMRISILIVTRFWQNHWCTLILIIRNEVMLCVYWIWPV